MCYIIPECWTVIGVTNWRHDPWNKDAVITSAVIYAGPWRCSFSPFLPGEVPRQKQLQRGSWKTPFAHHGHFVLLTLLTFPPLCLLCREQQSWGSPGRCHFHLAWKCPGTCHAWVGILRLSWPSLLGASLSDCSFPSARWEEEKERWWAWWARFGSMEVSIGGCKGRWWVGLGWVGVKEDGEQRLREKRAQNGKIRKMGNCKWGNLSAFWMICCLSWSLLPFVQGLHVHFLLQMGGFGAH